MAILSKASFTTYKQVCEDLIKELVSHEEMNKEVPMALRRMERSLKHYMQFDENIWGIQIASIYIQLCDEEPTDKNIHLCYILGCCYDMLAIHCTMLDDLVDDDANRFGKPTWNTLNKKKPSVVVDLILVKDVIYRILSLHFGKLQVYEALVNTFTKMFYVHALGQSYNLLTDIRTKADWASISENSLHVKTKYEYIEGCIGPFQLSMDFAGIPIPDHLWKMIETFQYNFTRFWIIQDDLNDSFRANLGNPVCDKDIKTGKVTWFLIKAKSMATPEQWNKIQESLGKDDPENIEIVKQIYCVLGLPQVCRKYLKETIEKLKAEIESVRQYGNGNGIANILETNLDKFLMSEEYTGFDYSA